MITISFNGTLYSIPATPLDQNWGAQLTSYLSALAAGAAPLNAASTFTAAVQFAAGLGIGPQSTPPTQNANAQLYTNPSTGQLMAVLPSPQSSTPVQLSNQYSAPTGPANEVFATPNGTSGAAALRALVAADIPALDASKITTGTLSSSLLTGVYSGITGLGTLSVPLLISDGSVSAPGLAFGADSVVGLSRIGGASWFSSHGAQIAGFVNDHSQTWSYVNMPALAGSGLNSIFTGVQWTGSGTGGGQQFGVMQGYSNGLAMSGALWFASSGAGTVNSFDTGLAPIRPGFSVYSTAVTMNGLNQSTNGGSVGDVSLYTSAIFAAGYDFNLAGLGTPRGLVGFAYGGPYGGPALAQTSLGKGFQYSVTDDPYTGFGFSAASHASVYVNSSSLPVLIADFTSTGMALTGAITGATWAGNALLLSQLAQSGASTNQVATWNGSAWVPATPAAPGTGTVTSVAATVPASVLTISGSPITTSGTLAFGLASSTTPNQVLASATSGVSSTPLAMRALVAADIPSIPFSQITGTVGVTQGGTGLTATALGSLLYGSASNVYSSLAGSTSATKQFLTQTGTGSASAAPAWGTIAAGDVPSILNATTFVTSATAPVFIASTNGSISAPAFAVNTNYGLIYDSANTALGFVAGGSERAYLTNAGLFVVAGGVTISSGSFSTGSFNIANTSGNYTYIGAPNQLCGVIKLAQSGTTTQTMLFIQPTGTLTGAGFSFNGETAAPSFSQVKAASYTVLAADTGAVFNNATAGGAVITFTLPTAAKGMTYTFCDVLTTALSGITVTPQAGDTIAYSTKTAGQSVSSPVAARGSMKISWGSTNTWVVEYFTGTWT